LLPCRRVPKKETLQGTEVLLGTEHNGEKQTFENIYVEAWLTNDKGYDYAASIVNTEEALSINRRIKDLTLYIFVATAIGLVVAFKGEIADLIRSILCN